MPDNYLAILKQMVDLIGHMAWPGATIILLLLIRSQVCLLLTTLSDRIKNPHSSFSIGPKGIEVSPVITHLVGEIPDTLKRLNDKLKSDPSFRIQLTLWLAVTESTNLTVTSFLDGAEYEDLRKKAVLHFKL